MQRHPTAYPDVNVVLETLLEQAQAILRDHTVGMYLYGSLALGDFDPQRSDIDYIVVTETTLSDDRVDALRDMHALFGASNSPWAERIEAAYIPRALLGHIGSPDERYPQIEKGGSIDLEPLESGWILQCQTLYDHGIVVAGPHPQTLFPPIDPDERRRVSALHATIWLDQANHDPTWRVWMQRQDNQAFVVLTLCRMLYTLDTAAVASKPAAARWMEQRTGACWSRLIQNALAGQYERAETTERDMQETIALLEYTVEVYKQFQQRDRQSSSSQERIKDVRVSVQAHE